MSDPVFIIGSIVVVVWSITTHEVAHGWVADKLGDPTARLMGRLTLNPIPHIDPVFTILIPGILFFMGAPIFGGAKPVPVDMRNLRHPWRDWALVGLAGPLSNILIGFLCAGLFSVFVRMGREVDTIGCMVLGMGALSNFALAGFNLLPIPPLDGSRVAQYFLPPTARRTYLQLERYGLFLVMGIVLLFRGALGWYLQSVIEPLLRLAGGVFGVTAELFTSINMILSP
ncbi:MAG: site-2 protease family protein [Planctomycetota bacterium]|nr:MAG: site-2 protease family protein [Planctomycetota bacterium]